MEAAKPTVVEDERVALFISHASPEDNPFTIWLGAKLSALGYEVWADVLRLRGGDDWQRKLEHALRIRARKVLLVANPLAVAKQGVRNEIQIASTVGRTIKDSEFIIPLRLAPFDAPFLIAHAQYIDFHSGWARGLAELLKTLDETYKVPRRAVEGTAMWQDIQLIHAKSVVAQPERLVSNESMQNPGGRHTAADRA
jgi:TIR domain